MEKDYKTARKVKFRLKNKLSNHIMKQMKIISIVFLFFQFNTAFSQTGHQLDLPDPLIAEAYEKASSQNVLAAVNNNVFFGYFSVCADGIGFGYGYTYPSLDGHQMSDALLWLGKLDIVKTNWEYVKKFQRENGELPLAILPDMGGKLIGPPGFQTSVDQNGGLYRHWVPGNPLRALAGVTYIQNADIIFRFTLDYKWLTTNLPSINLSGDNLASLVTKDPTVAGAGYYIERPLRIEYDGVSQCHAVDAFYRLSALNDADGLVETIRSVCNAGRVSGYYWQERYNEKGGYGAKKYNEYPANLIRIIQRFLLGVEYGLDGTLYLTPVAPEEFWDAGFGQILAWQDSRISYKMKTGIIEGNYTGKTARKLSARLKTSQTGKQFRAVIDG